MQIPRQKSAPPASPRGELHAPQPLLPGAHVRAARGRVHGHAAGAEEAAGDRQAAVACRGKPMEKMGKPWEIYL